ncbi:MAG: hypothetical protein V4629_11695 [Pseudomonadota bacterium]
MLVFHYRSSNEHSLYQGLEAAACAVALGQNIKVVFNSNSLHIMKNYLLKNSGLDLDDYLILFDSCCVVLGADENIISFLPQAKSILAF